MSGSGKRCTQLGGLLNPAEQGCASSCQTARLLTLASAHPDLWPWSKLSQLSVPQIPQASSGENSSTYLVGVLGGKDLVVKNAPKVNYPHCHKVYSTSVSLRQFWYPRSLRRNQKSFIFYKYPPFWLPQTLWIGSQTFHPFPSETSFYYQLQRVSESLLWRQHLPSSVLLWKEKKKVSTCSRSEHCSLSETLCTLSLCWQLYHTLHFKKTSWTESPKLITLY